MSACDIISGHATVAQIAKNQQLAWPSAHGNSSGAAAVCGAVRWQCQKVTLWPVAVVNELFHHQPAHVALLIMLLSVSCHMQLPALTHIHTIVGMMQQV